MRYGHSHDGDNEPAYRHGRHQEGYITNALLGTGTRINVSDFVTSISRRFARPSHEDYFRYASSAFSFPYATKIVTKWRAR